jgi:23S rRNA pseudouridine2605 synthase
MVRLQKFLAEAGVCSRRAGEQAILAGRVKVNGQFVRQLGTRVDPAHDTVQVDDLPVRARRKLYIALHKPRGCLCTRSDPQQRRTLADLLPKEWRHLSHVGRLDRESEGLIFLTNDGDFALRLTHPRFGVRKTYLVTLEGRAAPAVPGRLVAGVREGTDLLQAARARLVSSNNTRSVIEVELSEGRNREIRRMCAALGLTVERLVRTQIGPIKLGELPAGKWRTLTEPEIKSLLAAL